MKATRSVSTIANSKKSAKRLSSIHVRVFREPQAVARCSR